MARPEAAGPSANKRHRYGAVGLEPQVRIVTGQRGIQRRYRRSIRWCWRLSQPRGLAGDGDLDLVWTVPLRRTARSQISVPSSYLACSPQAASGRIHEHDLPVERWPGGLAAIGTSGSSRGAEHFGSSEQRPASRRAMLMASSHMFLTKTAAELAL